MPLPTGMAMPTGSGPAEREGRQVRGGIGGMGLGINMMPSNKLHRGDGGGQSHAKAVTN